MTTRKAMFRARMNWTRIIPKKSSGPCCRYARPPKKLWFIATAAIAKTATPRQSSCRMAECPTRNYSSMAVDSRNGRRPIFPSRPAQETAESTPNDSQSNNVEAQSLRGGRRIGALGAGRVLHLHGTEKGHAPGGVFETHAPV